MKNKKDLKYYLSLNYPFEVRKLSKEEGGGYLIWLKDIPECSTDGATVADAVRMLEDAKKCYFQWCIENNKKIPEPMEEPEEVEKMTGRISLRIPKELHYRLLKNARRQKLSLSKYTLYKLAH